MKKHLFLLLGLAVSTRTFALTTAPALKGAAFAAHMAKEYAHAGALWEQALHLPGTKPSAGDFYNAACRGSHEIL